MLGVLALLTVVVHARCLLFAVINAVCTLVRAFSFAFAGLRAARRTHDQMLEVVLRCPIGYLDALPPGRMLNRSVRCLMPCRCCTGQVV